MRVRQWNPDEDFQTVCDMFYALIQFHAKHSPFKGLFNSSRDDCDKEVARSLSDSGSVCLIAELDDGSPAGFCAISIPDGSDADELPEIHWLYVNPNCRGVGIATQLINCAIACMSKLCPDAVGYDIGVASWNEPALALYSKMGFVPRQVKLIRPADMK